MILPSPSLEKIGPPQLPSTATRNILQYLTFLYLRTNNVASLIQTQLQPSCIFVPQMCIFFKQDILHMQNIQNLNGTELNICNKILDAKYFWSLKTLISLSNF